MNQPPPIVLPIKATYTYSVQEVTEGFKSHVRYNFGPLKFIPYLGAAIIFCVVFSLFWARQDILSTFLPGILMGAFFLFINPFARCQFRRRFQSNPHKNTQVSWIFSEEKLSSEGDGFNSSLAWKKVFRFLDSPKGFLVYPQKQIFYWIPFSSFKSTSEIDCVRQIAKSQVATYKTVG